LAAFVRRGARIGLDRPAAATTSTALGGSGLAALLRARLLGGAAAAFRSLRPLRAFAPLRALPLLAQAATLRLGRLLLAATLLLALLRRLLPALLGLRLLLPLLVRAATLRLGRLLLAATLLLAL
jgi:hypothetical protein